MKPRILLIGTLPTNDAFGGASISLKNLVDSLAQRNDISISIVDTSGIRGSGIKSVFNFVKVLRLIIKEIYYNDVIALHVAHASFYYWGSLIFLITLFYRKPFILRKFNGADHYTGRNLKSKIGDILINNVDIYLAQTRQYTQNCRSRGKSRSIWFPTTRPITQFSTQPHIRNRCRRFVYIGHVRSYKGMNEIVDAAKKISSDITIDIYGPLFDDLHPGIFDNSENLFYRGVLLPSEVVETLLNYDAFILPTKASTEGYPGSVF
jgi:glycosyltransferase involved in cell wall biosynthesis